MNSQPLQPSTIAAFEKRQADLEAALFKDCGVEPGRPDGWKRVALVLANRHVPAFGPEDLAKGKGRPRLATDDVDLVRAMHELVMAKKSIRNAAQIVATRRKESANGVEARYRRIIASWRKAHAEVMQNKRSRRRE